MTGCTAAQHEGWPSPVVAAIHGPHGTARVCAGCLPGHLAYLVHQAGDGYEAHVEDVAAVLIVPKPERVAA